MINDIKNSIKAKLYDFTYTPFMSSMVISWLVINHKYILIYMSSYDLEKKLILLNKHNFSLHTPLLDIPWAMNFWIPIAFGLFYTFLYPLASKKFYEYTLEKNKELKKIKKDIEDVTPLTQEEARSLRESITQLTENKYELEKKLIEVEDRYKNKVQEFNNKNIKLPTALVTKENKEVTNLPKVIKDKEDDSIKIFRFFYESNYKPVVETQLLDNIVNKTKIARPKAKKILDQLVQDNILFIKSSQYASDRRISITKKGNDLLIEMFDKDK